MSDLVRGVRALQRRLWQAALASGDTEGRGIAEPLIWPEWHAVQWAAANPRIDPDWPPAYRVTGWRDGAPVMVGIERPKLEGEA